MSQLYDNFNDRYINKPEWKCLGITRLLDVLYSNILSLSDIYRYGQDIFSLFLVSVYSSLSWN